MVRPRNSLNSSGLQYEFNALVGGAVKLEFEFFGHRSMTLAGAITLPHKIDLLGAGGIRGQTIFKPDPLVIGPIGKDNWVAFGVVYDQSVRMIQNVQLDLSYGSIHGLPHGN